LLYNSFTTFHSWTGLLHDLVVKVRHHKTPHLVGLGLHRDYLLGQAVVDLWPNDVAPVHVFSMLAQPLDLVEREPAILFPRDLAGCPINGEVSKKLLDHGAIAVRIGALLMHRPLAGNGGGEWKRLPRHSYADGRINRWRAVGVDHTDAEIAPSELVNPLGGRLAPGGVGLTPLIGQV